MGKAMGRWLMAALTLLLVMGCKPSLPKGVVSEGKMEDVLYDYHLAQSMANKSDEEGVNQRTYADAVFRKHGITQEDFDKSLAYYVRHTELLQKIYDKLATRFKKEAEGLGMSDADINQYATLSATGDTANVWKGASSLLLLPQRPFNQSTFAINADTAYHAGDRISLNFDCDYLYQDGSKNAFVIFAIVYKNDSVAYTQRQMYSSTHQNISIGDDKSIGIKAIKGYFIIPKRQSEMESQTTLQLLFVRNIQMVRIHKPKGEIANAIAADTATLRMHTVDTANNLRRPSSIPLPPARHSGPLKPVPSDLPPKIVK